VQIPNKKLCEVIYRWERLDKELVKLSTKIDLSDETQGLIQTLTSDWDKLNRENIKLDQLMFCFCSKKESPALLKETSERFQVNLTKLKDQLINLPYSKVKLLNSFLKNINKLLERLADFFMSESLFNAPISIYGPLESHKYNFFHPCKSANNRLDDFLKALELKNSRYLWLRIS
jgi:hypothetical protein